MSAPPLRKEIDTDSKSYAAASAPTQSQKEQERESQHNDDDKDREHGKEEAKEAHVEPPAPAESPPVSHDVKVPEPGFDAPEDKMQGGRAPLPGVPAPAWQLLNGASAAMPALYTALHAAIYAMTAWLHHAAPDVRLRHRCDDLC